LSVKNEAVFWERPYFFKIIDELQADVALVNTLPESITYFLHTNMETHLNTSPLRSD
jgi:hypothetical protein